MADDNRNIWADRPRRTGKGALRYFEAGAGAVLVLIHGVGLRAEAWCAVLDALSSDFRVISVDMPGHGASPLQGAERLADFTSRLADFVSDLPGPVRVYGHSMGALLALELGAGLPAKIGAIAALNTVYRRSPDAATAVRARADALLSTGVTDPEPTLSRWFGANPEGTAATCAAACRRWLSTGDPAGYAAAYRVFAHHDGPSEATLAKIRCPVLFLTAANDRNSTPEMSQSLARRTGGAAQIIEDAAHMLPMTHAGPVASRLRAHFRQSQSTGLGG